MVAIHYLGGDFDGATFEFRFPYLTDWSLCKHIKLDSSGNPINVKEFWAVQDEGKRNIFHQGYCNQCIKGLGYLW